MGVRIDVDQDAIAEFCRRNRIRSLALFGSVLREDFRPDSDVDVLVEFEADAKLRLGDLVRIQEEMEALFGRPVDLVEREALRNPFRRHDILKTAELLYAA